MYPKNSRFSGMYNDFEDNFYESFDGGQDAYYDEENSYYDDEERDNVRSKYDGFLYSSDRDYGIYNMELTDVASDTECTGLLARGYGEPDELSEYREMYNFGVADDDE